MIYFFYYIPVIDKHFLPSDRHYSLLCYVSDACLPGSWSMDGIPPCSYCPKGTYQDSYGGIDCKICPRSLTTDLDGAESFQHCQGTTINKKQYYVLQT